MQVGIQGISTQVSFKSIWELNTYEKCRTQFSTIFTKSRFLLKIVKLTLIIKINITYVYIYSSKRVEIFFKCHHVYHVIVVIKM